MLLLALVAAVALATSACSSSSVSGDAIVVNDVGLSNADFQKRLDLIKADATYAKKPTAPHACATISRFGRK